jgi:hypothetical protein
MAIALPVGGRLTACSSLAMRVQRAGTSARMSGGDSLDTLPDALSLPDEIRAENDKYAQIEF